MSEIHTETGYSGTHKKFSFDDHLKSEKEYDLKRREYLFKKFNDLPLEQQTEYTLKATKQAIERFKMFGRYETSIEICLLEILENI